MVDIHIITQLIRYMKKKLNQNKDEEVGKSGKVQ
jgi:hypothetical protein